MATLTLQNLIDNRLTVRLGYIQKIEVHNMLCNHISGTQVQSPYGNILSTPSPLYYKNGTIFTPDAVDVTTGVISIASLQPGDDINITLSFQYFSNSDLQNFYRLALQRLNNAPPISGYTFADSTTGATDNYPVDTEDYLTQYAYKQCLETLMMDLMGWKAGIIFRDPQTLGSFLQAKSSEIEMYLPSVLLTVKGRKNLLPRSVSGGRWKVPAQVGESTWQSFTVIRA